MSEQNNGIINGGTPENPQGDKAGTKKKNVFVRIWERAQRGYVNARQTKTGRVVIGCTKAAAIGLGLYEAGKFGYRRGVKDATPQDIPAAIPPIEEEPSAPEEEPVAEEDPAVEEETEI